jgi:hypothetical protein
MLRAYSNLEVEYFYSQTQTETSIFTLGIFLTPLLDFRKDLFDILNVLMSVTLITAGVTIMSSRVLRLESPLTTPF